MQFLSCLETFESSDLESERYYFELVYVIIVICGLNHGYVMLDGYFGSNYSDLDVHLIWHALGFYDSARFK